jgi:predicted O-methyltransferase YrrM
VICLCGPLGRVLCYEWFKANPKLTCLELGSLFDPFLKNRSYAYHTQNHTPCYGCFPVNNISDEQTKFIDRLIENPLIENECYYAHNYHDTLEFYLGMFQCNLDRMRSNTLIRLKKNRNESFMRYLLSYIECSKLENYINEKGHKITEGHCFQNQKLTKRLVDLIREVNPMRVLEIGFNAGHSSTLFLMNSNAKVVSFDLFWHEYVNVGKEYIDKHFPERHILIRGDSLNTLPEFLKVNKEKYDLFYIDGGKHGDTIRSDLNACMKLSHEKSLIILNDTIMTKNEFKCGWNYGATNTWLDMIDEDKIIENGSEDYEVGKGISWGNFNKKLDLDEEFLRYKALSRLDLYKGIEGVYYGKNYVMVDKLTKFYIDVFGHMENNELRMVKFYRAYSSSNYDEKVALYESLLKNPELENYLHSWTSYNLSLTYPYDSNPIPKIIHFIYLKQREFEKYHLRCISSASHFFPNYEVWVHNDIEPVGNPHWDAMKKLSNVQIKKTRRRKMFDDFPLRFVQYEADVIRLELLYKYGGIYLDTDLLVVKNFENIINTGKSLYISEETENGGLINSFLASKKGNEFLRIWLDSFRCGLRMDNWAYHIRESNAILLKNNPHYKIKYGVERLSYIHFFPFSWTNRGAFDGSWKVVLDEKTYGVHLFDTILHDALQSNKFFEDYYNI